MFDIWFTSCHNIYGCFFAPKDMLEYAFLKLRPVYKMGIFSLGFVWFNVVQSGSNLTEKGDGGVCILGHFFNIEEAHGRRR